MELKLEGIKTGKAGDELIQQMLGDIFTGLKAKLVQPVVEGNQRIAGRLEEIEAQNRVREAELVEKLAILETKVQQLPLVLLAALRDAISQAGGGNQDVE